MNDLAEIEGVFGRLVYARMVAIAAVLDETGRLAAAMICGELETGEEQALAELAGESLERESAINH